MFYYAFTLRKTSFPSFISFYDNEILRWRALFPLATIHYYYEATNGLHLHGMLRSPTKVYIKSRLYKLHPGVGWNLDFAAARSIHAWSRYIVKDIREETNLVNYEHHIESEFNDHHFQLFEMESENTLPAERSGVKDGELLESELEKELKEQSNLMLRLKNIRLV